MANILENPNFLFFQSIARKLPKKFRSFLKDHEFFPFFDFIKWQLVDLQRPRYFHPYGIDFYTGLPGAGKTMMISAELAEYRKKFGYQILIATNYKWKDEDFPITGIKDILKVYDKPIIIGYDEIQNDFDSREWLNSDKALSERLTQSRKITGMKILATAQRFSFVDRRLRQLTNFVYDCRTFFSRLTIARIYAPMVKEKIEAGSYQEKLSQKDLGTKWLVQTDKLRDSYDTFQILKSFSQKVGKSQSD